MLKKRSEKTLCLQVPFIFIGVDFSINLPVTNCISYHLLTRPLPRFFRKSPWKPDSPRWKPHKAKARNLAQVSYKLCRQLPKRFTLFIKIRDIFLKKRENNLYSTCDFIFKMIIDSCYCCITRYWIFFISPPPSPSIKSTLHSLCYLTITTYSIKIHLCSNKNYWQLGINISLLKINFLKCLFWQVPLFISLKPRITKEF